MSAWTISDAPKAVVKEMLNSHLHLFALNHEVAKSIISFIFCYFDASGEFNQRQASVEWFIALMCIILFLLIILLIICCIKRSQGEMYPGESSACYDSLGEILIYII